MQVSYLCKSCRSLNDLIFYKNSNDFAHSCKCGLVSDVNLVKDDNNNIKEVIISQKHNFTTPESLATLEVVEAASIKENFAEFEHTPKLLYDVNYEDIFNSKLKDHVLKEINSCYRLKNAELSTIKHLYIVLNSAGAFDRSYEKVRFISLLYNGKFNGYKSEELKCLCGQTHNTQRKRNGKVIKCERFGISAKAMSLPRLYNMFYVALFDNVVVPEISKLIKKEEKDVSI